MRNVLNSISVGPSPRLARAAASLVARCTAEQIVAVADHAGNAVAGAARGQVLARELLADRRRQAVLVVLDDEDHRQLPDRREVDRFVKIAFAGAAVADKGRRDARLPPQLRGEREAVGDRQHRRQVADHADDVVVEDAEMKRCDRGRR